MMEAVFESDYSRTQLFPLHNAVAMRNFSEVQNLVENGYNINEQHYDRVTPLHMACLTGDIGITEYLLEKGAWINAQSIDNSTPLCDACAGGSVECVKLLLNMGAAVNPPLLLSTPLHEASLRGNTEIVALLIAAGAHLDPNDTHYGTPLHAACSMGTPSLSCIRCLLKSGVKVNAIKNHKTPLHYIAMNSRNADAARLLLQYGADPYLKTNSGLTARQIAGQGSDMANLLAAFERTPRSLAHFCRLTVRRQLGPHRLKLLERLEIPAILIHYLQ
ncbi:ankyrin repeat and SOCS box protein 13-like isoform X1 [Macrobrachium nipponense]|uniref:ankyrin repeat and SOCS box protein 13-like isoform X1 n=2 Tax=Macrobrachium nipponense TaxID=159736 RepID=UPI0030C8D0F7